MRLRFAIISLSLCLCSSLPLACSEDADPVISPGAAGGGGTPAVCDPAVAEPGDACDDTAEPGDLCHLGPRGSCNVLDLICRSGVWTLLGDDRDCGLGGQGGADQGGAGGAAGGMENTSGDR